MRHALLLALLPALALADAPPSHAIDGTRSELVVKLFKGGLAARLAHDHVIAATGVTGDVRFDPKRPAESSISITVDARTLRADDPALRKRYGLKGALSKSDITKIETAMRGASQLDVKKHKHITFKSTAVKYLKDAELKGVTWKIYEVAGELTLRGKSKKVKLQTRARYADGRFTAVGALRFKQSAFGYQPYSAAFGAIKVKDEVALRVSIVAALPEKK